MRPIVPFVCLLAGSIRLAASEEPSPVPTSPTRLDAPIVVREFAPPEPIPPKEVPAMRIESAVTRQLDGARVTVLRGEASTLPDIPRPVVPEPPTVEEIAAREVLARNQPQTVFLQFGATVYDQRVSVVSWPHPGNPEVRYEAAVGLDFGLFANVGGFHTKTGPTASCCCTRKSRPGRWSIGAQPCRRWPRKPIG